ncbi:hypothetical protein ARMA_0451 [Ardenticatena maritima]|uniref:DUF4126 domain-containing protein n=1 Tax=Ardenticatena maritima TaxID=872965 RepID=A0A0M9UBN2_9CHLR|nr:DUF4126 domain-containing protein [Ardenticatena maritima]KPL87789.1 hypothetical protein SE16_09485 [Ardenticatena maritima]GAP62028.1 hypothetical protein ARMA_0451 [Ardenticatena maritima]
MRVDLFNTLLTGFGLSSAAGLNAYIPLLITGLVARYTSLVQLRAPFDVLEHPAVLLTLTLLLIVEMGADKIALLDSLNDAINTLVRPAAGAILFAGTSGVADIDPSIALVLGLLSAGTVHTTKSATRPAVTAASGGCANPIVSLLEDVVAVALVLLALLAPVLLAACFLLAAVWLARRWQRRRKSLSAPT